MGKRGVECSICSHPERAGLDLAISRGVAMAALAKRYGLSADALGRHKKHHLTPQMRARLIAGPSIENLDLDHLREVESQSLLMHLIAIRQRLFAALDLAEEVADANQATRVTSQLHKNLELTGSLLGQLNVGHQTTNILISATYVTMRVELMKALAPYAEARQAVAAVLHTLETDAATEITDKAERGLKR